MRQEFASNIILNVYISCWVDPKSKNTSKNSKFSHLANLAMEIARISTSCTKVHLYTNIESNLWQKIFTPITEIYENALEIHFVSREDLTVGDDSLFIPWLLTWQHKKQMKADVVEGSQNSIYLYLEDDAIFTQQNLMYFLEYRPILDKVGLIPGFVRAEWSDVHHEWIHPDSFSDDANEPLFTIPGHDGYLHQRKNPYSALILLDKDLGLEYVKSESFKQHEAWKKHPIIYDIGSTAALGLIAENVPEGFINRMAVPVLTESYSPKIGSVVRHQGNKYANDIWQKHYLLFGKNAGMKLIVKRTARNYILRIFRGDSIHVVKGYLKKIINRNTSSKH